MICGGKTDEAQLYIEPTLIRCTADSTAPIMQEEIFGPLLPIIVIPDIKFAINFIRARCVHSTHAHTVGIQTYTSTDIEPN